METLLLASTTIWSIQHLVVAVCRDALIDRFGEVLYYKVRAGSDLTWFIANTYLASTVHSESPLLWKGSAAIAVPIRVVGFLFMLITWFTAPSIMDIPVQRKYKLQRRGDKPVKQRQPSATSDSKPTPIIPISPLNKITRHPIFFGSFIHYLSFLLLDTHKSDLYHILPLFALSIVGVYHMELRSKSDPAFTPLYQQTSILPFIALLEGRTSLTSDDQNQLIKALVTSVVALLLLTTGLGAMDWPPGAYLCLHVCCIGLSDSIHKLRRGAAQAKS